MQRLVRYLMVLLACNGVLMYAAAEEVINEPHLERSKELILLAQGLALVRNEKNKELAAFIKTHPHVVTLSFLEEDYVNGLVADEGFKSVKATLLMEAAYRGNLKQVEILCREGANPLRMDRHYKRAFDYTYGQDKAIMAWEYQQSEADKTCNPQEALMIMAGIAINEGRMEALLCAYEKKWYERVQQSVRDYTRKLGGCQFSVPSRQLLKRHANRLASIIERQNQK